jgi:HEAT repeat protein
MPKTLDNSPKPKRIFLRLVYGIAIIVFIVFPIYWFGIRAYMFKAKVKALLSLYLDAYKPTADREAAREEILVFSKRAVPVLVRELETDKKYNYAGKSAIAELLAKIKDPRAVSGLIRCVVEDKEHLEYLKKLKYFGKMMEEADKAEQALRNYDAFIDDIAKALGIIRHPNTLSVLKTLSKDKSNEGNYLQVFEIRVIGYMKNKEYIPELAGTLRDKQEKILIRAEAATALGRIGDRSAFEPLIEALSYQGDIQLKAVMALGDLKDPRAVAPLIKLYNSPQFSFPAGLQRNIIYSLGDIGGPNAAAGLIKIHETSNDAELLEAAKDAYRILKKNQTQ